MMFCMHCDNTRLVCENHRGRPWLGDRACDCGGGGEPCPICDRTDPDRVPEVPERFFTGVKRKTW